MTCNHSLSPVLLERSPCQLPLSGPWECHWNTAEGRYALSLLASACISFPRQASDQLVSFVLPASSFQQACTAGVNQRRQPLPFLALLFPCAQCLLPLPSQQVYTSCPPESWPDEGFPISSTCALSGTKERLPVVSQTGCLCSHALTPLLAFVLPLGLGYWLYLALRTPAGILSA